jgi:hypothetical protein
MFGMSDRQFRNEIHKLRQEGLAIISTSKQRGYIYSTKKDMNREEALIMKREIYSRIKKLIETVRPVEKLLQINEQLRFTGV